MERILQTTEEDTSILQTQASLQEYEYIGQAYAMEIGYFFYISCFISFTILKNIHGHIASLEFYFASKDWPFMKTSRDILFYSKFLKIIVVFLIINPLITLPIWAYTLIQDETSGKLNLGYTVLLLGFALIFICIVSLNLQLAHFQLGKCSVTLTFMSIILFQVYQVMILLEDTEVSFFGLSSLFLGLNTIFIVIFIFLQSSKSGGTFLDIYKSLKKRCRNPEYIKTDTNVQSILIKQSQDEDYELSKPEISQFLTIIKNEADFEKSILSGALQQFMRKTSKRSKTCLAVFIYLLSLGVLAIYALLVDKYTDERNLGYLTIVSVIVCDFIVLFLSKVKMQNGTLDLIVMAALMRFLLFIFGGTYWFVGYCLLYLFVISIITKEIVNKRWPLMQTDRTSVLQHVNILETPEFSYAVTTFLFLVTIGVYIVEPIQDIPQGPIVLFNTEYEFWLLGLMTLFISAWLFFYLLGHRIYSRKQLGIKDIIKYYAGFKGFDPQYIFDLLAYVLLVIAGLIWYRATEEVFICWSFIILPACWEVFTIFLTNWQRNDYMIIGDPQRMNLMEQERVERARKKLRQSSQQSFDENQIEDSQLLLQDSSPNKITKQDILISKESEIFGEQAGNNLKKSKADFTWAQGIEDEISEMVINLKSSKNKQILEKYQSIDFEALGIDPGQMQIKIKRFHV